MRVNLFKQHSQTIATMNDVLSLRPKVRDGLGVAYAIGERLRREIEGRHGEEANEIMDKYSHLIGLAIHRHSLCESKPPKK